MEVIYDGAGVGYEPENAASYPSTENTKYAGHAFCDDGWFIAETQTELEGMCQKISAFCELFKVKLNASKSYCAADRGDKPNKSVWKGWRPGQVWLRDHTARGGEGQWE